MSGSLSRRVTSSVASQLLLRRKASSTTCNRPNTSATFTFLTAPKDTPIASSSSSSSSSLRLQNYRVFSSTKDGDESAAPDKNQQSVTAAPQKDNNISSSSSSSATDVEDQDPFGLNFQDSFHEETGNIGPKDFLPPNYIRDSQTGKFTGKIMAEISKEDQQMLNMSQVSKDRLLRLRVEENIAKNDALDIRNDGSHTMANVARRIREEEIAMNTLGREVQQVRAMDGDDNYDDDDDDDGKGGSVPLTRDELESLHKFMQKTSPKREDEKLAELLRKESENLLPITVARKSSTKSVGEYVNNDGFNGATTHENPDLDLEWLSAPAQRIMASADIDAEDLEEPFANLMPSDLNPAKKVNRRRAKPIPKELLHHNNLSLLRRYVTPGGQIMNRIQSRLGAKDQRKVSKLVKRARHLGLIPVIGQWKFEDRGSVKDPSIYEDKEWEQKLMERGLVERKSPLWEKKKHQVASAVSGSNGSSSSSSNYGKVSSGW